MINENYKLQIDYDNITINDKLTISKYLHDATTRWTRE